MSDDKLGRALRAKPKLVLRPGLLLCHQIPKPMHGVAPRTILGPKWWDETRKAAYSASNYCCLACGVRKWSARSRKWLEGHEVYSIDYLLGRMVYVETVALCHFCHNYIHRGRLDALLEAEEIPQAKYVSIIQHGDDVLRLAGLKQKVQYSGPFAEWEDWRLVLNGKEYKPKFKTENAWLKEYGR